MGLIRWWQWAFHLLVDADKSSPSYGLPLRLFGATGVRMVYYNWSKSDPRSSTPDIFNIPHGCQLKSSACREMQQAQAREGVLSCTAQAAPYYGQTCAEAHGAGWCCDPAEVDNDGQCNGWSKSKTCYFECVGKGWDPHTKNCTLLQSVL